MDLEALRSEIQAATPLTYFNGERGQTLQLDTLFALGASQDHLFTLEFGVALDSSHRKTSIFQNHKSVAQHAEWAEKEWTRLERLGKKIFYPPHQPAPLGLHVNPCALLLKERKDAVPSDPDDRRYKARLLMDLKLGGGQLTMAPRIWLCRECGTALSYLYWTLQMHFSIGKLHARTLYS